MDYKWDCNMHRGKILMSGSDGMTEVVRGMRAFPLSRMPLMHLDLASGCPELPTSLLNFRTVRNQAWLLKDVLRVSANSFGSFTVQKGPDKGLATAL